MAAARFPATILRYRNQDWAARVGLAGLSEADWIGHFGRFEPLPGSLETPLALRYHGHQFRSYNPELGDGRGFLFAQVHDLKDGGCSISAQGSGTTPWFARPPTDGSPSRAACARFWPRRCWKRRASTPRRASA